VYVGGGIQKSLQELEGWINDKKEGEKILLEEDFNARTGEEGGGIGRDWEEVVEGGRQKRSKDKKVDNKEGGVSRKQRMGNIQWDNKRG